MALGTLTNQPEIFMHIQESEIDQNDLPGIFQDSQRIQKKKKNISKNCQEYQIPEGYRQSKFMHYMKNLHRDLISSS